MNSNNTPFEDRIKQYLKEHLTIKAESFSELSMDGDFLGNSVKITVFIDDEAVAYSTARPRGRR